jgi:hypothetical protein
MRTTRIQLAVAVVCCLSIFPTATAFGQSSNSDQIVEEARTAYANLRDQGVKEFRCEVRVDWDAALASMKTDAAGREQLLPLLRQMHFEAVMGSMVAPRVSQHFDGAPPNEETAARLREMTGGVERLLSGAWQELAVFLFDSPLPPDGNYRVTAQGDEFRIAFGKEPVGIIETMNKDHALEEMLIATDRSTVTVRPQFTRGEKGYMPIVLDTSVAAAGADKAESHVEITYQAHDGFDLPQTVKVTDKQLAGGTPVQFSFSNYQITK